MRKSILSAISMLLTVLMIVMSCPLQAIAYYIPQIDQTTSEQCETETLDLSEVEILSEDISKRGESEKHFKLSDGSFVAVQYSEPVHYAGEDGAWLDIDNTLNFDEANSTDDFDGYTNTANSFKAKFANAAEDALFYIEGSDGENKIKFELINDDINIAEANINLNTSVINIENDASILSKNEEMIACNNVSSEIVYDEIIDDVDFNYTVTARGVKENIIINRRLDNYNFKFSIDAGDLILAKSSSGSITATDDDGVVIYEIPAPFMYDDNSRYSDDVHYTLSSKINGKYTLTISADSSWINSSDTTFPVIIDPMVNTADNDITLDATYVTSADADTNKSNVPAMLIGRYTDNSINRAYVKMWLPTISRNSVITSAQLCVYQADKSSGTHIVELREAASAWDVSTITWNNQPGYNDTIIDYVDVYLGKTVEFKCWDITRYALEHTDTLTSNGFVLKAVDETASVYNRMLNATVATDYKPYILVKYRSQMGIEDDFSYITYSDCNNGTAYVNNYTGNLTYIKNLVTSASDIMPASLDLIYNSSIAYNKFSSSNADRLNTCLYSGMYLSAGWKLSAQQSIVPVAQMTKDLVLDDSEYEYGYIYTDEDGTEHYFYRDTENTESVTYIDENGLGMTITHDETNNQYKLETEGGYTKLFKIIRDMGGMKTSDNGYIISETDADGNSITYSYDETYPGRLVSITDPSGTKIQLGYNSYGYLTSVTMGSIALSMSYQMSASNFSVPVLLLSVSSNANSNTTYFTYNDGTDILNHGLLDITNADGSKLEFTYKDKYYDSFIEGLKIDSVAWRTGAGGGTISALYEYEESFATTIHYTGTDCLNCEATTSVDDLYFTYTFDNYGSLTLAYSENYDRNIVYSTDTYGYSSVQLNDPELSLTSMAQVGIINENLLGDINYFDSDTEFSCTSGVTMTDAPSYEYISARTRKVVFNSASDKIYLTKALSAGSYALSFYAKYGDDASYVLSAKNSNGSIIESTETFGSSTVVNDSEWTKITLEVTLTTSDSITFELTALNAGTIYLNGIMLGDSEEYMPATYNLLYNGGFENGLDGWDISHTNSFAISTNSDVKFGDKAISAVGAITSEYTISTEYDVDSNPLYSYIVSGWAKAESIRNTDEHAAFELYAKVKYSYTDTDSVLKSAVKETKIPFSSDTTEWQYASGVIEMPELEGGQTLLRIDSIEIGGRYANNANNIMFDNFALVCDTAITIDYDSLGNVTEVSVDNEDSYTYEYDDDDNLIKIIDVDGSYTEYEYTNGNLTAVYDVDKDGVKTVTEQYTYYDNDRLKTNSVDGISTTYEYTSWGITSKQTTVRTVDETIYAIVTESVYSDINKKLLSETDSFGNTTSYGYNEDLLLSYIQDAKGNQIRYTYNRNTITNMFADTDKDGVADTGESMVSYTYDIYGRLTGVSTATTDYVIAYNSANRLASVSVAGESVPMITYLYNDKYTVNTGYTYTNGYTVFYEYDTVGNLKVLSKNNNVSTTYNYDTNFNIVKEEHFESGTVTKYSYTECGTLYLIEKVCGNNTLRSYAVENEATAAYEYITEINGVPLAYSSVYDEETDITAYVINGVAEITSETDSFGRTKTVSLKSRTGEELICTYSYVEKNISGELRTSEYISSITYTGLTSKDYSYTYDENGNIISVCDSIYTTTYVYDSLNQIERENNQKFNKTWVYTYDASGNILSKSEYPYTIGELGAAIDTITYSYGNTNWGDRLTSYNETVITYDVQGNPSNWRDGITLTWDKNKLTSTNKNGEITSYIYDNNGLLIKKILDNDNWIDYFWDNGRLIAEFFCGGVTKQYYLYDENGSPLGWQYVFDNENKYFYYIKNQNDDIVGFIDDLGNVVAEYEYDAWGKSTYISSDCNGYPVAEYNSLRYRGYFYDVDSELYFIGNDYYDPSVCRFVNPKSTKEINTLGNVLDYNMYTYCENNPVSNTAIVLQDNIVQSYKTFGDYILYDVPIYCQGGYQLCWAFCQIMIEHYYDKTLQLKDDPIDAAIDLAKLVHGEVNWNSGAYPTNRSKIIDKSNVTSIRQLYILLKEHGPIYGYYMYSGSDWRMWGESHVIVITGVNVSTGMVYTNNPWGVKHVQSFDDFRHQLLHPTKGYVPWALYEYWLIKI